MSRWPWTFRTVTATESVETRSNLKSAIAPPTLSPRTIAKAMFTFQRHNAIRRGKEEDVFIL